MVKHDDDDVDDDGGDDDDDDDDDDEWCGVGSNIIQHLAQKRTIKLAPWVQGFGYSLHHSVRLFVEVAPVRSGVPLLRRTFCDMIRSVELVNEVPLVLLPRP